MNASPSPTPRSERHAPLHLWRIAQVFLTTLHALFGAPEDIAARHTLTAKPRQLLLAWVRAGEALMRRLLLLEAAASPKPNTRPLLHPSRQRARRARAFVADKPEDWRVSFRCLLGPPASRRRVFINAHEARRRDTGGPRFYSAWPLAERYEALLRVFNAPASYARRLVQRLHAKPHRRAELLAMPRLRKPASGAPPDARDMIGRENLAAIDRALADTS